jgi:excisionase family DNA binding protein
MEALDDGESLWDANDVARYLRASRSWVYHRAESGELPCLRIGGLLRFEPEAVRAYARGERPAEERPAALPLSPRALRRGV